MDQRFRILVFLLAIIIAFNVWNIVIAQKEYDASLNNTPLGECPSPCTTDADAGFVLDVYPNVTINYFCWNGVSAAELIPAPDAISSTPFGTPDPTIALHVCKASIRSIPKAAQVFPYFNPQLVYGKCGITYKCAVKYYNPQ